jgi:HEAT repeat protein
MSKRRRLIFAALFVAVLAGLMWSLLHPRETEPIVDGRPLSSLLDYYVSCQSDAQRKQADQALDTVGTNALPTLLRMLRRADSPFKRKAMELVQKQHVIPVHYTPAERQNQAAYFAFLRLGGRASAAVPALMAIYEQRCSPFSRQCAAGSLRAIGPAANVAIPVLKRGMADTNTLVRCDTLMALSQMQPELTMPALTNALSDPDAKVRFFACSALEWMGRSPGGSKVRHPEAPWAKLAVSALEKALTDPDPTVRGGAVGALRAFEAEPAPVNLPTGDASNRAPAQPHASLDLWVRNDTARVLEDVKLLWGTKLVWGKGPLLPSGAKVVLWDCERPSRDTAAVLVAEHKDGQPHSLEVNLAALKALPAGKHEVVFVVTAQDQARLEVDGPPCRYNLLVLEAAKQRWASPELAASNAVPSWAELRLDFPSDWTNGLPVCPNGGIYTLGRIGESAKCSVGGEGHTLQ